MTAKNKTYLITAGIATVIATVIAAVVVWASNNVDAVEM
tara:strand:+ start:1829 stop:1945 length:117 start_codon:yes stop_codon:yes gene_type:complete